MANYFLFLDELKSNDIYKNFCIGGCFIEESHYRNVVVKKMNTLKNDVFGNTGLVLHESELEQKKGKFNILNKNDKEQLFWEKLKIIFDECDIHTLCAGINHDNLKKYYPSNKERYSEYYITLQIILENFVHFLVANKGTGCVYFESRDITADYEMQVQYESIKNNGTLFIPSSVMKTRLKAISFPLKLDNNVGLQLADFVPNPVARDFQGIPQREYNIFTNIKSKAYNGNIDKNDRFGFKKIL